jgi:hypothetical protein
MSVRTAWRRGRGADRASRCSLRAAHEGQHGLPNRPCAVDRLQIVRPHPCVRSLRTARTPLTCGNTPGSSPSPSSFPPPACRRAPSRPPAAENARRRTACSEAPATVAGRAGCLRDPGGRTDALRSRIDTSRSAQVRCSATSTAVLPSSNRGLTWAYVLLFGIGKHTFGSSRIRCRRPTSRLSSSTSRRLEPQDRHILRIHRTSWSLRARDGRDTDPGAWAVSVGMESAKCTKTPTRGGGPAPGCSSSGR